MHTISRRVDVPNSVDLLSSDLGNLPSTLIPRDGIEEPINEGVGVSLPTDANVSTMEEPSMLQHLPNGWIAPIVRDSLWENTDFEIVVSSLKNSGTCEDLINVQTDHGLPGFL